jgi:four helix bundle protein
MREYQGFESLKIWQESMQLCIQIYKLIKENKDYGLKDQIQRSAVSIPSNIAEGYERQTDKEFVHFLFIAKGSCAELRTQLYLAKELQYIKEEPVKILIERTIMLSAMIHSLINTRRK